MVALGKKEMQDINAEKDVRTALCFPPPLSRLSCATSTKTVPSSQASSRPSCSCPEERRSAGAVARLTVWFYAGVAELTPFFFACSFGSIILYLL